MKRSLMRPTAALFPIVLLAAALFGNAITSANLFICYCVVQLFTLCSAESFRNAAAREPGVRKVDKRFGGTFPVMLIGIAAYISLVWFKTDKTVLLKEYACIIAAAVIINFEQLFEERMWALGHQVDGVMLSIISNVLLLVGLLVDASSGIAAPIDVSNFYTACGAGLGLLISVSTSYIVEPMRAFSLLPRNIAFFPKAAVQSLLYPAAVIAVLVLTADKGTKIEITPEIPMLMAGMILWRLSRTVCRRANDESRPLNLMLTVVCGGLIIVSIWLPDLGKYIMAAVAAMICAEIVFCAPGWRIYLGTVLLVGAFYLKMMPVLPENWNMIAVIACSIIAIILNMHKAFLKKV